MWFGHDCTCERFDIVCRCTTLHRSADCRSSVSRAPIHIRWLSSMMAQFVRLRMKAGSSYCMLDLVQQALVNRLLLEKRKQVIWTRRRAQTACHR